MNTTMLSKLKTARLRDLALLCGTAALITLLTWTRSSLFLDSQEPDALGLLMSLATVLLGLVSLVLLLSIVCRLPAALWRLLVELWRRVKSFGLLRLFIFMSALVECALVLITAALWGYDA
jgi:hypothetical protein